MARKAEGLSLSWNDKLNFVQTLTTRSCPGCRGCAMTSRRTPNFRAISLSRCGHCSSLLKPTCTNLAQWKFGWLRTYQ